MLAATVIVWLKIFIELRNLDLEQVDPLYMFEGPLRVG